MNINKSGKADLDLNLGVMTALVSPFDKNGNVDKEAQAKLIEFQLAAGVHSLLVLGGTGEVLSCPRDKRKDLLENAVKVVNKRVPVICGICDLGVYDAIRDAVEARDAGCDYILLSTPFGGNTPVQGIIDFYKAVHDACGLPILIYNFPGRTGFNCSAAIVTQILDANVGIVGIKECNCKLEQTIEHLYLNGERLCVLSGNEDSCAWEMLCGAKGVIAASANVYPEICVEIYNLAKAGDIKGVTELASKFVKLNRLLFAAPNPGCIKYGLSLRGIDVGETILPLVPVPEDVKVAVKAEMKAVGLI